MDQSNKLIKKKVLLLSSNPKDSGHLRLAEEFRKIKQTLNAAKYRDQFTIIQGEAVTVDDLRNYLLTNQPNIIHFSGHGSSNGIYVENESGHTHRIPIRALANLFGFFKDKIECVILNACYAEQQAKAINDTIPYVIGTNQAIQDGDAIHFATGFYNALFTGYTIKKAFDVGYNSVEMSRNNSDTERGLRDSRFPTSHTSQYETLPIILLENKALLNNFKQEHSAGSDAKQSPYSDNYEYDFFISYANSDAAWVHGFLQNSLEHAGKRCLTVEDFRLGQPELVEIERAVQQSRRILLVLSPDYLNNSDHVDNIVNALEHYRGKTVSDWPVIPLLLRAVNLPSRLDFLVGLDFSNKETQFTYLQRLIDTALLPVDDPDSKPHAPYPGLRAFTEAEADLFYGRNQVVNELLTHFRSHSVLSIIGASGSGKSSLVYAGLIPALQKTRLLGSDRWCIKTMRPETDVMASFEKLLPTKKEQQAAAIDRLLQKHSAQRLLIFIDQFEEIFHQPESVANAFCDTLQSLDQFESIYLVLTLRADFFHRLLELPLWSLIERSQYNLLPLKQEALERIIAEPAKKAGVFIDPVLLERMISDAANEPGILPFIQETMNLLWDQLQYRYLPLEAYEELQLHGEDGKLMAVGLKAAIAIHAEACFKTLSNEEKNIAQQIFIRLIQFGEGRANTRRQQTLDDLDMGLKVIPETFNNTLHNLANDKHRLLILSQNQQQNTAYSDRHINIHIDIAHESLLEAWPRLKKWVNDAQEHEKMRRHFLYRSNEYIALNKKGAFLDKLELKTALVWQTSNKAIYIDTKIEHYIQASEKKLRQRTIKQIAIPLFLVIVVLMSYPIGKSVYKQYLRYQAIKKSGEMVLMKPDKIVMGRDQKGVNYSPQWTIEQWNTYNIEKYEVSNERYCLCIKAGVCKDKSDSAICDNNDEKNFPVVNVSLKAAANYCHWLNRRLPHEAEWEFAAKQTDVITATLKTDELYKVNIRRDTTQSIYASHSIDKTDNGLYGLVGNVREWTLSSPVKYPITDKNNSWYKIDIHNSPKIAVTRGASIKNTRAEFVSSWRQSARSNEGYSDIGFRCVSDVVKDVIKNEKSEK